MSDLPSNPMRSAILDLLSTEPGLSFSELNRRLRAVPAVAASVGNGALEWHLHQLQRAKQVSSRRSGTSRRYYPAGLTHSSDLDACALVQAPSRWHLARALRNSQGLTVRQLFELVPGLQGQTGEAVRAQLRLLRAGGLVVADRQGKQQCYRPTHLLDRALRALSSHLALTPPQPGSSGTSSALGSPLPSAALAPSPVSATG